MEYCDGGPLDVAVDEGRFHVDGDLDGPLDLEAICTTLAEVASALAFLHSKNILHRDLKAKNVLLASTEVCCFLGVRSCFGET
jgi:serine/threonine protein kinase